MELGFSKYLQPWTFQESLTSFKQSLWSWSAQQTCLTTRQRKWVLLSLRVTFPVSPHSDFFDRVPLRGNLEEFLPLTNLAITLTWCSMLGESFWKVLLVFSVKVYIVFIGSFGVLIEHCSIWERIRNLFLIYANIHTFSSVEYGIERVFKQMYGEDFPNLSVSECTGPCQSRSQHVLGNVLLKIFLLVRKTWKRLIPPRREFPFMQKLTCNFSQPRDIILNFLHMRISFFFSHRCLLQDITREAAFIMTNTDPLVDFARPTLRNIIDIGGLGVRPAQPLSEVCVRGYS